MEVIRADNGNSQKKCNSNVHVVKEIIAENHAAELSTVSLCDVIRHNLPSTLYSTTSVYWSFIIKHTITPERKHVMAGMIMHVYLKDLG